MSTNFKNFQDGIRLVPRSADPSSPLEGDIQRADGSARTKGLWEYKNSVWVPISDQLVVQSRTTTYTALISDGLIGADTSGGAWTLTIPTPVGNTGKSFKIFKTTSDFNVLTLSAAAGNFVGLEGSSSTTTINTFGEELEVISDNANWLIVQRIVPSMVTVYTPSFTGISALGNGYSFASWKRIGNSVQLSVQFAGGTTTTYSAATTITVSVPSGIVLDTSTLVDTRDQLSGTGSLNNATSSFYIIPQIATSTTLEMVYNSAASSPAVVTTASPALLASATSSKFSFTCTYPVSGWKA